MGKKVELISQLVEKKLGDENIKNIFVPLKRRTLNVS